LKRLKKSGVFVRENCLSRFESGTANTKTPRCKHCPGPAPIPDGIGGPDGVWFGPDILSPVMSDFWSAVSALLSAGSQLPPNRVTIPLAKNGSMSCSASRSRNFSKKCHKHKHKQ